MDNEAVKYAIRAYVKEFDSVAIFLSSNGITEVSKALSEVRYLTILTNNFELYANATSRVSITGGVKQRNGLFGPEVLNRIEEFWANVTIFDVGGISANGFMCHWDDEREIKKLLFTKSTGVRLIPVSWKVIGRNDAFVVSLVRSINANIDRTGETIIVTKRPPEPPETDPEQVEDFHEELNSLKKLGIEIEIVD